MMKKLYYALMPLFFLLLLTACHVAKNMSLNADQYTAQPITMISHLAHGEMGKLGIQIIPIGDTYRIIIPVDNIFETREPEIKETAYAGLSELSGFLKLFMPEKMTITGYTDSLGNDADDEKLSELQAHSLKNFLWKKGFSHYCLITKGVGKKASNTIASNRSIEGSIFNRRLEITFRTHCQ